MNLVAVIEMLRLLQTMGYAQRLLSTPPSETPGIQPMKGGDLNRLLVLLLRLFLSRFVWKVLKTSVDESEDNVLSTFANPEGSKYTRVSMRDYIQKMR